MPYQEDLDPLQDLSTNVICFYLVEELPGMDSVECIGKINVHNVDSFNLLNHIAPLFNS